MAPASDAAASPAAPKALRKGALVKLDGQAYKGSLEAAASDTALPAYVLEGPGEILAIRDAYAQVRWRRPVPDVWLRLDQLLPCDAA
ncbi:MAG: NAD(P)H-quinone oxidoreductase subunit O [Synechococcaceae cyanobacterium]